MTVHLHELVDVLNSKGLPLLMDSNMPVDRATEKINSTLQIASTCQAFYGGDATRICALGVYPEYIVLPYESCWIEFSISEPQGRCRLGFACKQDGKYVQLYCFLKPTKGDWHYLFDGHISDEGRTAFWELKTLNIERAADCYMFTLGCFLTALNCTNVKKVRNEPKINKKKKRRSRRKTPFYSYWTLHLDLTAPSSPHENLGGTHASPRVHLRRGHFRRLPSGLVWVQPCVVGNKRLGMVHKDYNCRSETSLAGAAQ